jgi:hypothetical protein
LSRARFLFLQAGVGILDYSTLRESTGAGGGGAPSPDVKMKVRKRQRAAQSAMHPCVWAPVWASWAVRWVVVADEPAHTVAACTYRTRARPAALVAVRCLRQARTAAVCSLTCCTRFSVLARVCVHACVLSRARRCVWSPPTDSRLDSKWIGFRVAHPAASIVLSTGCVATSSGKPACPRAGACSSSARCPSRWAASSCPST